MAGREYSKLGCLSPETLQVLDSLGFARATPVQEATIPLFVGNKDVAVDACTGSGKTLAFIIPVVEKLRRLEAPLRKHEVGAVIVSPTRELAKQIFSVAEPFIASVPNLTAALLVGGSGPSEDIQRLKENGANVLIGTPGRLDDIRQRCAAWLEMRTVEVLVLDEADRLLDMGFRAQLDAIISALPRQRRTGLFSATQTEAVQALARAGLRNAVRVNVAVSSVGANNTDGASSNLAARDNGTTADSAAVARRTPGSLSIHCVTVEAQDKLAAVASFLQAHPGAKTIVYFLTCACVDYASKALPSLLEKQDSSAGRSTAKQKKQKKKAAKGLVAGEPSCDAAAVQPGDGPATTESQGNENGNNNNNNQTGHEPATVSSSVKIHSLHGRMKQAAREATLEAFGSSTGQGAVLLATDVAARGLDIPDVDWVLQADPPQDPAAFVHRVGRTARMGRSGQALLLLLPTEDAYVKFLELRGVPIARASAEDVLGSNVSMKGSGSSDSKPSGQDVLPSQASFLRSLSLADRAVMEAGVKAFVSYIRGYKEHHCTFIFRLQDLPLGQLATSFGLLRLPRMPELKKATIEGFTPSDVDPDTIRFLDRAREKQRQALLKKRQENGDTNAKPSSNPRLTAAQRAKQAAVTAAAAAGSGARLTAAKRRALAAADEEEDLRQEYQALRKLKRGKMSHHEFDKVIGLVHDDGVDGDGGSLVKAMQQRVTKLKRKHKKLAARGEDP